MTNVRACTQRLNADRESKPSAKNFSTSRSRAFLILESIDYQHIPQCFARIQDSCLCLIKRVIQLQFAYMSKSSPRDRLSHACIQRSEGQARATKMEVRQTPRPLLRLVSVPHAIAESLSTLPILLKGPTSAARKTSLDRPIERVSKLTMFLRVLDISNTVIRSASCLALELGICNKYDIANTIQGCL